MAVFVFALTTVNTQDLEALTMYLGTTQPLLEKAGAEILQSYEIADTIVGEKLPQMATVVRYPSRSAVDMVFESTEYHALKEIRERAFLTYQIGIVETDSQSFPLKQ
jgi:uncharacterized protein (DUF1330 family)